MLYKGNIHTSPSNFRFEPAFPGLIQSTYIFKNNIEYPLSFYYASSNNERIIPSLLSYLITPNNKASINKISFDPK